MMKYVLPCLVFLFSAHSFAADYPYYRNAKCFFAAEDGRTAYIELFMSRELKEKGQALITVEAQDFPMVADSGTYSLQGDGPSRNLDVRTSTGFVIQLTFSAGMDGETQKLLGTIQAASLQKHLSCDFVTFRRN